MENFAQKFCMHAQGFLIQENLHTQDHNNLPSRSSSQTLESRKRCKVSTPTLKTPTPPPPMAETCMHAWPHHVMRIPQSILK